jgi:hypothetical protein
MGVEVASMAGSRTCVCSRFNSRLSPGSWGQCEDVWRSRQGGFWLSDDVRQRFECAAAAHAAENARTRMMLE